MPKPLAFDVVVIGSGSAGWSAAEAARNAGVSVALVEKGVLGGECPNWGCVPSKALLRAAFFARNEDAGRALGFNALGSGVTLPLAQAWRAKAVERITGGDRYPHLAERLGVTLLTGEARFVDAKLLSIGEMLVSGKAFVVATGAEEFVPPVTGLSDIGYLTSRNVHELLRAPKSIGIIGGGPVGCEFASFFSAIGVRTVLIQSGPTILPREDADTSRAAHEALAKRGVEVITGATLHEVINGRGVYGLRVTVGEAETTHAVDAVMITAGKRGGAEALGLETVGVPADARGFLKTDAMQRTKARHVFAAGDAVAGLQFTHVAHHEGVVAGWNAALEAKGKRAGWRKSDVRVVPRVTFVDPEVASVGLTEAEARKKFGKVRVGSYGVPHLGRAVTDGTTEGFVKIIAHPKTLRVVGCHALSPHAGELIHEAALAIHLGATVDRVGSMIHAYPTYSEALVAAANLCAAAKPL